jgi:hypothetical protein
MSKPFTTLHRRTRRHSGYALPPGTLARLRRVKAAELTDRQRPLLVGTTEHPTADVPGGWDGPRHGPKERVK